MSVAAAPLFIAAICSASDTYPPTVAAPTPAPTVGAVPASEPPPIARSVAVKAASVATGAVTAPPTGTVLPEAFMYAPISGA